MLLVILSVISAHIINGQTTVEEFEFGKIKHGSGLLSIRGYKLKNALMEVTVISYGCIIQSILVRDRTGVFDDVVTGYDDINGYLENNNYDGAIVGRYANRIHKAEFFLDGQTYKLNPSSWDDNHIHGGTVGFDRKIWQGNIIYNGVEMFHYSPDGDEGYPGNLNVIVTFQLIGSSLEISYDAQSSKTTVINLTHHNYFNLNGHLSWGIVNDLHLSIPASEYLETDEENIPTGQKLNVDGTIYDFRRGSYLSADLLSRTPEGYGYDLNYCYPDDGQYRQAAILVSPRTGRLLEVKTTQPGLQLYTANWIDTMGKYKTSYGKNTAVALETQHWPDSPNHPRFPSTTLQAGERFKQKTKLSFYRV